MRENMARILRRVANWFDPQEPYDFDVDLVPYCDLDLLTTYDLNGWSDK